jgi:hypothetical protein
MISSELFDRTFKDEAFYDRNPYGPDLVIGSDGRPSGTVT